MQLASRIAALIVVLFSCLIAGDLGAFINIPSILFVFPGTIFTMYAKYGKELFSPSSDQIKDQIGREGISISFMWGYLGALVGFVIILGNLSDMAALGHASVVSLFLPKIDPYLEADFIAKINGMLSEPLAAS